MASAGEQLLTLQQSISRQNDPQWPDDYIQTLYFTEVEELFHVEYCGPFYEDTYQNLLQTLCIPDVAGKLKSLAIRGPDEGANGTRNWDFTALIEAQADFSNLTTFSVEPTAPEHHNKSIVGIDYEEDGQIGSLLSLMPLLKALTVPSAPDASFFKRPEHPLAVLRVDSGFSHQNFVRNFSESICFTQMKMLDFGDYNQRYMKNYPEECTPLSDYEELFKSQAFQRMNGFYLRNSELTAEQLTQLGQLRQEVSFYVIQAHGKYVR